MLKTQEILVIEHREPYLQTKIAGLSRRDSENNNFIQGLAMNTKNYVDFTIHNAS